MKTMSVKEVKVPPKKTRDLSTYQFFEVLQQEWLQADLRCKIYPSVKDKNYWQKVCAYKKEAIDRIADRNQLPTIFTDANMRREFEKKVYRNESYPLFTYKDEQNRSEQEYLDLLYYYYKGSSVRCEEFDQVRVGEIEEYQPFDAFITIRFPEGIEKMPVAKTTRIL